MGTTGTLTSAYPPASVAMEPYGSGSQICQISSQCVHFNGILTVCNVSLSSTQQDMVIRGEAESGSFNLLFYYHI